MVKYVAFIPELTERSQIKPRIEADAGVVQQETRLREATLAWWQAHEAQLVELPETKALMPVRTAFLESFEATVRPIGLLDEFKTMGVIVSWWEEVYDNSADLKRLASLGFRGLIDSWIESIRDIVEDDEEDDDKKSSQQEDPLGHKVVGRLVPDYVQELETAEATVATLIQEKEAFEQGDGEDTDEEGEPVNVAKDLQTQLKNAKHAIKDAQKRLKVLLGGDRKRGSIKCEAKLGHDTTALEEELARLQSQVSPVEAQIAGWEAELLPYKDVLDRLKEARKGLRALKTELVTRLQTASDALSDGEAQRLVLDLLRDELLGQLERYVTEHRQRVIAAVETWWDKYRVTLGEIEAKDADVNRRLDEMLRGLGYVDGI